MGQSLTSHDCQTQRLIQICPRFARPEKFSLSDAKPYAQYANKFDETTQGK